LSFSPDFDDSDKVISLDWDWFWQELDLKVGIHIGDVPKCSVFHSHLLYATTDSIEEKIFHSYFNISWAFFCLGLGLSSDGTYKGG
jgi:hypothetical protein